jgi:hypothetical protein
MICYPQQIKIYSCSRLIQDIAAWQLTFVIDPTMHRHSSALEAPGGCDLMHKLEGSEGPQLCSQ